MNNTIEFLDAEQTISPLTFIKSFKLTNCFELDKLKQLKLNKITDSHLYTDGLFLVKHKDYFEFFFGVNDTTSLKEGLTHILSNSLIRLPVKTIIIGRKPYLEKLSPIFLDLGFTLVKRQGRVRLLTKPKNKIVSKVQSDTVINADMEKADMNITAELAKPTDVDDIFSVLSERFDFYKDNLPDVDEIADNISKKQIIVLKDSGKIIGCLYYEMKSNNYYGIFDAIKKEYKNKFLFRYLSQFRDNYFKSNNIQPIRHYGWRDLDNKRLLRYSKLQGEQQDGVYLYNFVYYQ